MSELVDDAMKELTALHARVKRAIHCGLNKIIEPNITEELRYIIRMEIFLLARVAADIERARTFKTDNHKVLALYAARGAAWFSDFLADGGLLWLGDPADLDRLHFSPGQH